MKTAETILKENSVYFSHPYLQKFILDEAISAMKSYAEQALDEYYKEERGEIVSAHEINKIKSQLK